VLSFLHSRSAAEYVGFWFPPESLAGISAFWALPAPPLSGPSEAVVLIRHSRAGLAYTFSFASMEEALEAVRAEMRCGLPIGRIAIYHAVPVHFSSRDSEVFVEPAAVPPFRRPPAVVSSFQRLVAPEPDISFLSRAFNAMRLRWWLPRPAPFAGFGSPPGRF
jgi:hypothetical protein